MTSIHYGVHRRGGLAATHELLADGHTSNQLTTAVRRGEVIRIRQGHYGCCVLTPAQVEAARVGGRLTGLSGARHYGIWSPLLHDLEIVVAANAAQLRTRFDPGMRLSAKRPPTYTAVAWRARRSPGTRTVVLPIECLEQIALTRPPSVAFAATESALYLGHVTVAEVRRLVARLPSTRRGRLAEVDRSSESGGESLFKFQIRREGIALAQQVTFDGVGDVDFLLGDRLVVEIDGYEFHKSAAQFEEDRRRDALLRALGYRVLRFSYRQVESRWEEVAAAVASAIRDGDHLFD